MKLIPDVYFLPEWGRLFEKHQGGEAVVYEFKHRLGHVQYQFIKKAVPQAIDGKTYHDTVTPFGYGGPLVLECAEDSRAELIRLYEEAFGDYCVDNCIIAEYVQFSPWLENHLDFRDVYELSHTGYTVGVDLTPGDFFMDEFDPVARNEARKAAKNGVTIDIDHDGSSLGEFIRLYGIMAEKNGISDYYRFDEEFFKRTFELLRGKVFLAHALLDGRSISSAMLIHHGDFLHGHLMGNDPDYYALHGNALIMEGTCRWGKENGKKWLHFGGAGSEKSLAFKKHFTRNGLYGRYAGRNIRNSLVYDRLVKIRLENGSIENKSYFPLYRG